MKIDVSHFIAEDNKILKKESSKIQKKEKKTEEILAKTQVGLGRRLSFAVQNLVQSFINLCEFYLC